MHVVGLLLASEEGDDPSQPFIILAKVLTTAILDGDASSDSGNDGTDRPGPPVCAWALLDAGPLENTAHT